MDAGCGMREWTPLEGQSPVSTLGTQCSRRAQPDPVFHRTKSVPASRSPKTKKAPEGAFCHFLANDYSSAEKPAFSSAARLSVACSAEGPSCSSTRLA